MWEFYGFDFDAGPAEEGCAARLRQQGLAGDDKVRWYWVSSRVMRGGSSWAGVYMRFSGVRWESGVGFPLTHPLCFEARLVG